MICDFRPGRRDPARAPLLHDRRGARARRRGDRARSSRAAPSGASSAPAARFWRREQGLSGRGRGAPGDRASGAVLGRSYTVPSACPTRRSSTCTSTPSTRSSTAPAGSPTSSRGPPSSRCRRSGSPTTARWRAPSSSSRRRKGTGVKPVIGCEVYVTDDRRAQQKGYAHLTLLAADNRGYANLIKLSSLGYLEGYYYKPRVDWELLERHADGVIALSGCLSGRVCKALEEGRRADAGAELDRLAAGLRARQRLRRAPERAPRRPGSGSCPSSTRSPPRRGCRPSSPATSTTSATRTRAPTRRCSASSRATRSRTRTTGSSTPTTSTSSRRTRWPPTSPAHADALRAQPRDRRALQRRDRARQDPAPALPGPGRPRRLRLPRRALRARPARSATRRSPTRSTSGFAFELKTIREMGFVDYFLIVWDFIRFAKSNGVSRRAGARLGRRKPRRLLPRDHRPRPDPPRADVRALPEPAPQGDARHGHRLRRRRARARHQLRHREVRPRPRRPDHHLLDDGRARRRSGTPAACSRFPTASSTGSRS